MFQLLILKVYDGLSLLRVRLGKKKNDVLLPYLGWKYLILILTFSREHTVLDKWVKRLVATIVL